MNILMAPLCVASCLDNDQAARTSRATRCRSVLLQRAGRGLAGSLPDGPGRRGRHHAVVHHLWSGAPPLEGDAFWSTIARNPQASMTWTSLPKITVWLFAEAPQPLAERDYQVLRTRSGVAPVTT